MEKIKKSKRKLSVGEIIIFSYLTIKLILLVVPFLWAFFTTLKDSLEFRYNMFGFPQSPSFKNYGVCLREMKTTYTDSANHFKQTFTFADMLWNSVTFSVVSALTPTVTLFVVGYATGMFAHYKFSKFMDMLILIINMVPIFGAQATELAMIKAFGIRNNFLGVTVLLRINFLNSYYFMVKGAFYSLRKSYYDAAQIDGAGNLQIMFRIMMPMMVEMFGIMYLLQFIAKWNDYGTPLLYLPAYPTASYGLWLFKNATTADVTHITVKLSACFMLVVPVIILFIFFNKYIMRGLRFDGGVKE